MATKKEKYLYPRGGVWWVKIPMGGAGRKPHYESTTVPVDPKNPSRVPEEAIAFRDRLLGEKHREELERRNPAAKKLLVNELLDDYLTSLHRRGKKSARQVAVVVNSKVRPFFGEMKAQGVTTEDVLRYRAKFPDDPHKQATANRHLSYLHAAFNYAKDKQRPPKVKAEHIPVFEMTDEKGNTRRGFIDYCGYKKILVELSPSLRPFFVCAYHVSTRKGELSRITWDQVDLKEDIIVLEKTKNGDDRSIPIYGEMVDALREQKKLRDREFPNTKRVFFWHNEPVTAGRGRPRRVQPGDGIEDFKDTWDAAVIRAGYPGLLVHDLRRSATRNMRKAGIDQSLRMKISGHKTTSMERRYNITDLDDIKSVGRRMAEWSKEQLQPTPGPVLVTKVVTDAA